MTKKHDIIWLESVDSTNNEASRMISNLDNLSVLSALSQTSGRGQRGNIWVSERGKNLTFSVILKFSNDESSKSNLLSKLYAKDQIVISNLTAISIIELLQKFGIDAKVKLPNDIYVAHKKICGILIEHAVKGEFISHSIVGIGLNVNQRDFDESLPNPTSINLCLNASKPIDTNECLELFLDIYKKNLRLLNEDRDLSVYYEINRALLL